MQQPKPRASLSEIGHLFLTDLRQRQAGGAARPKRTPPVSIDLTPEEFGSALHVHADHEEPAGDRPAPLLSLVVAHHFGPAALDRTAQYARHLAASENQVGLIELGDDGLRLTCFDAAGPDEPAAQAQVEPADARRIGQAIEEMSWDVRHWLLVLPAGARSASARALLANIRHWTLLVEAGDEGIVSGYRALKGLAAMGKASVSLAVLDADEEAQVSAIHRKLSAAAKQFLDQPVELEGRVAANEGVRQHVALWCRASAAVTDHWTAVTDFAARAIAPALQTKPQPQPQPEAAVAANEPPPAPPAEPAPRPQIQTAAPAPSAPRTEPIAMTQSPICEVIDLAPGAGDQAVLAAVLSQRTDLIALPIKPPAYERAAVLVDREGRLRLLAVPDAVLADLPAISAAYRWISENRPLLKMAAPQMNIDAAALPRLCLLIDAQAAGSMAESLKSILQAGNVTVETYRLLRWGKKSGLLLEAA